jgi:hypothetical protein
MEEISFSRQNQCNLVKQDIRIKLSSWSYEMFGKDVAEVYNKFFEIKVFAGTVNNAGKWATRIS